MLYNGLMKKLVLVDGNAIVHRAFHALPPLHKKDGKLTNAVYGFFAMVLKIVSDLNPDGLIVCFDRAAPTFRKQMYAGYQATRPKMDDGLSFQFEVIRDVLNKIKVPIFELDGYEADDLIGTLASQAVDTKAFDQVIILTGDRDLLQLVNDKVLILAPVVGVTKMILFDEEKVREKYGLEPHQIVDYKSLVGDNSDNYPGVSGIGPKTASNLINQFGSLEGIYSNLGEISPKISEKLAIDAEQSALAKKLATIDCNAPIKLESEVCMLSNMDRKALLESFEDLSFNSLITRFRLDKKTTEEKAENKEKDSKDQMDLFN
jgi:DNA polymerase I